MTGFGKAHRLEDDRIAPRSHSVSPVFVSLRPIAAAMSPARTSSISSRLLACICSSRPTRSLRPFERVVDVGAGVQHPGVHPEERQLPDVGIGHDLEGERRERRVIGGMALGVRRVVVRQWPRHRRHVHRRREVVDHRVEQLLHALVLERGAAEHRHHVAGDRRLAHRGADLLLAQRLPLEVLVQERRRRAPPTASSSLVAHARATFFRSGFRHRALDELLAQRFVVVDDFDLPDQVDDPGEQLPRAERQLDRDRLGAEALAHHLHARGRSPRRRGPSC